MRFLAPAKINLSLRVLHRRADGFHDLETLMVPISLADELQIEIGGDSLAFTCSDPDVPGDDTNLVVQAARLFLAKTERTSGLRIALQKNVPHGAGLGGGSSDAAATLLALDQLFGTRLGTAELVALAAKLGSDVPFFIHRSAAICRGRGELVEPVAWNESLPLLLLKPPFPVSTPWAYSRWQTARALPEIDTAPQPFSWGDLVNDLERPVFEKHLFLAHLKRWLRAQPEVSGALMSGSGSTMFAVLRSASLADSLAMRARAEFSESLWASACVTL